MERLKPRDLQTAARLADLLVYVVGLTGAVAGGLLFRRGDMAEAVIAWVLTFVAGAALGLAAWLTRGVAELLSTTRRIEDDVAELRGASVARERRADEHPDVYGRRRGWGPSGRP